MNAINVACCDYAFILSGLSLFISIIWFLLSSRFVIFDALYSVSVFRSSRSCLTVFSRAFFGEVISSPPFVLLLFVFFVSAVDFHPVGFSHDE